MGNSSSCEDSITISNARSRTIIGIVHQYRVNKESYWQLKANLGKYEAGIEGRSKQQSTEITIPPGSSNICSLTFLTYRATDPYVTIYEKGAEEDPICHNYPAPNNRTLIVIPPGGIVLAKNGTRWTDEEGQTWK